MCNRLHTGRTSVTEIRLKVIILKSLVALKGHIAWPGTCVSTSTDGQYRGLTKVTLRSWLSLILTPKAAILLAILSLCRPGLAQQQVSFALLQPGAIEPVPIVKSAPRATVPEAPADHRFWDRDNSILFAANAAFSAADFVVTRDNLRNGGQELNPVTRLVSGSTTGLALNFAGETVGVVGLSYFFHKTGHHKLERAVSLLNAGSSAAAVSFGLAHR